MIFGHGPLPRTTSAARTAALALVLAVAVAGCAAPRPSTEPLGVGPLSANYRITRRTVHSSDRRAPPSVAKRVVPPEPAADGGIKTVASASGETSDKARSLDSKDKSTPKRVLQAALFVGDYRGEDVSTYRLEGMPEREDRDPNARVTVNSSEDKTFDVVLVDSSNGKEICTLHAVIGESGATIDKGQKCFEQTGSDGSATALIRTGTVSVDERRLVLDLELDFEMHVPGQDSSGTLAYHFDGTRR